jgi:hypothetical protein
MKRAIAFLLAGSGVTFTIALLLAPAACSSTLAQPFQDLKEQPITLYHLQNYEPPPPVPGAPAGALPGIPPQFQQLLQHGAAMLPPGLIPPGILPGTAPAPLVQDAPRFYNFRILRTMAITDSKMRQEIVELFGKDSNFTTATQSCMFPEFAFQIGQAGPPGAPQGVPSSRPPADILVSLACDRVEMKNYGWPHGGGANTGITPDTEKKIVAIAQRAFGG